MYVYLYVIFNKYIMCYHIGVIYEMKIHIINVCILIVINIIVINMIKNVSF